MQNLFGFDFDEIFRDTTKSYERCVIETVKAFTGAEPPAELREEWKAVMHNDWERSHKLIESMGKSAKYEEVVDCFQELYLGNGKHRGYINDEPWLLKDPGLLQSLGRLGKRVIISGAPEVEIVHSLERNIGSKYKDCIDHIYGMDKCKKGKGVTLRKVILKFNPEVTFFCDDKTGAVRETSAVSSDGRIVKVYGIMPPGVSDESGYGSRMKEAGAAGTFRDINHYCAYLLGALSQG